MLVSPSPTFLSDFTDQRREATRPVEARGPDFASRFDDDTLFFDAFRSPDGRQAVLIGPPLFNLEPAFASLEVCDARIRHKLPTRLRKLDRQTQLWVDAPADVERLTVSSGLGAVEVAVGPNLGHLFAGRRVLLTKSKDNPIPWILDWARFNRDLNGADAVLFFDNGSTLYDAATLDAALSSLAGIERSLVVSWPFKFGPQGLDAWRFWDSDFCELAILEAARWRFLAEARSVMTSDVDELTFGTSPFEAAESSMFGAARYQGRLVVGTGSDGGAPPIDERRHRDYATVLRPDRRRGRFGWERDANASPPKWTIVPKRCPAAAQWHTHSIKGWLASRPLRRDITFGHFMPISTSWKYQRDGNAPFDPALHERDGTLERAFARTDWDR